MSGSGGGPEVGAAARGGMICSVLVQGSYLAGSRDLAVGGGGGEPGRVVVRCRLLSTGSLNQSYSAYDTWDRRRHIAGREHIGSCCRIGSNGVAVASNTAPDFSSSTGQDGTGNNRIDQIPYNRQP